MKWKTQFKCSDTMTVLDANIFDTRNVASSLLCKNKGSIIFVVGKSPMDIMEPIFVCRKKSHKTYNENRSKQH